MMEINGSLQGVIWFMAKDLEDCPKFEIINESSADIPDPTITINGIFVDDKHHFEDDEGNVIHHWCARFDDKLIYVKIPTLTAGDKFTIYYVKNPSRIRKFMHRLSKFMR